MAKIDLNKLAQFNEEIYRNKWLNRDLSLVGQAGVGKTTFALEDAAFVASLFEETLPLYVIDTEGAYELNLDDEYVLEKLLEAGVDLDIVNVANLIDKHGLLKGLEHLFAEIKRIRKEISQNDTPAIFIVDSLSDLRQRLVDAFVEARKGEKESVLEMFKKDNRNLQDWAKTTAVLNDLTAIAKNNNIHAIFTSREKLEKDGDILVPLIDGHKHIEYEADVYIRLFFDEQVINGEIKEVRRAELKKIRGIRLDHVPIIDGTFDEYKTFIDSKTRRK
jgi:KaiC/GvpD/RAD55 family RecA-like ATPase